MDERRAYAAVAGKVIMRLRTKDVSQEELAESAGLSQSALSRFENGQSLPDIYELRGLARAFKLTTDALVAKIEQAFVKTQDAAKKVSPGLPWAEIAAGMVAGLALVGVAAMLEEAERNKKTGRKKS